MAEKDYYKTLGVDKTATAAEIKSAFRKKAKECHPDLNKDDPNATEKFKEVEEAYSVLSDESKRKTYDQFGSAAFNQGAGGNPYGGGNPYANYGGASSFNFNGSDVDFGDIFDSIFGAGGDDSFTSTFGGSRGRRNSSIRGNDILMEMPLSFKEAIFGTKKDFKIDVTEDCPDCDGKGGFDEEECDYCHGSGTITSEQHTILGSFMSRSACPNCHGTGKVFRKKCSTCHGKGKVTENKTLTVNIPAGVATGDRLRVSGKGGAGSNGGENGDLYLEFRVSPDKHFERDGADIYLEVPLTITEAILGCKKEIPTIDGNVKINISAGVDTGDKERLRGKGIDDKYHKIKGDMYIIYKVITPKRLTREQKDLLTSLADTDFTDSTIKEFTNFTEENE